MITRTGLARTELNDISPSDVLQDLIDRNTTVFVQHVFCAPGDETVHILGESEISRIDGKLVLSSVRSAKVRWRIDPAEFTLTQLDANGIEFRNETHRYAAFIATDSFVNEWRRFSGT